MNKWSLSTIWVSQNVSGTSYCCLLSYNNRHVTCLSTTCNPLKSVFWICPVMLYSISDHIWCAKSHLECTRKPRPHHAHACNRLKPNPSLEFYKTRVQSRLQCTGHRLEQLVQCLVQRMDSSSWAWPDQTPTCGKSHLHRVCPSFCYTRCPRSLRILLPRDLPTWSYHPPVSRLFKWVERVRCYRRNLNHLNETN